MAGRGRPRKKPKETKQPACPKKRDGILQQPQDGPQEQKPNKLRDKTKTAEKTVSSLREDEMIRQQKTDPGSKNGPGARPKVSATAAKGVKSATSPEEPTKTQTEATTQIKDSPNNAGRKKSSKTKSDVDSTEEDTAGNSLKTTKAKKCGGKVKQSVKPAGKTESDSQVQKKAERLKSRAKPAAANTPDLALVKEEAFSAKTKKELHSILRETLEKLKIRKRKRSEAAKVVNSIVTTIVEHLKKNTGPFTDAEQLNSGSYYENLKISNPDEFDVMICVPVERVEVKPFGHTGAFYSVSLKRGNSPLKEFQTGENGILSASRLLEKFREEVKKSVKGNTEWKVERKKPGCPAVTLATDDISVDVVLSLKVKSRWPDFTSKGFKIERWLGTKAREKYRWKPYFLVPKYEGRGTAVEDGVLAKDTWRLSFSNIEKAIMLSHGSEKTCCEAGGEHCCRKDCLKLLKHILHQLKEGNTALEKFCSYHAKTTLLHACCTRNRDSDWSDSLLGQCFKQLVEDFASYLEKGELLNFFVPTQNLLSGIEQNTCKSLASKIREEAVNDFPLFQ